MKILYDHNMLSSFYLWFDSHLSDKATAYTNLESTFYNYADERLTNKTVFGSPFKQFVFNDAVSGANIITTISGDGSIIAKGTSGMKIDYNEGRVIFDNGMSSNLSVSGSFAVKDFNIYISNQTEEELILEGNFENNPRFTTTQQQVKPYDYVTPAVFLSIEGGGNEPYAFGGEDMTTTRIKAVVLAEDVYKLDGILSIFKDSPQTCISKIPFTGAPLGEFNDIKSHYVTGFNYNDVAANYDTDVYHVKVATVSKFSDRAKKAIPSTLFVGFIDFEVEQNRFPRI